MVVPVEIMALAGGWFLDLLLGDPERLPHPVVGMGNATAFFEKRLNRGGHRVAKGAFTAIFLIGAVFAASWGVVKLLQSVMWGELAFETLAVYFCLAGHTLVKEVRAAFEASGRSVEEGRRRVARIVGRDTSNLSVREIRTASLETLSENLSDGVVSPLFWFMLLGVPGMLAYKMVNTLDSMIGYKNSRYLDFGRWAARIDDVANYIPARLTALLMLIVSGRIGLSGFVLKFGKEHASPNSGYPEAALAGILDCRFGGTHDYFGEPVYKPYIGVNDRALDEADLRKSIRVNRMVEVAMVLVAMSVCYLRLRYFQS